ncbi:hypothetical protein Tco_0996917 [Tanacetum coccineum]
MMDVPINQEDPIVQRTLLIDTVISMVTDKTASTPTPPTTQAQVQMAFDLLLERQFQRISKAFVKWRVRHIDTTQSKNRITSHSGTQNRRDLPRTENGKENGAGEEADDELRRFGLELRGENSWRN